MAKENREKNRTEQNKPRSVHWRVSKFQYAWKDMDPNLSSLSLSSTSKLTLKIKLSSIESR